MAILVDSNTKLCVSGITGREGAFHALNNKKYGTNVVAGVTPGKAGQDVNGIPVFNTVADAVAERQANTAMVFVPPRFAADAIYEAVDAGIETVICITEGIPAHDMLQLYPYVRARGATLLGPNCPGALSPGVANVGIIGNGAGLVMSTLDVVAGAGGTPANFLDVGGGAQADEIVTAMEVLLSDEKVRAVLFNVFGGITRCDEVARGVLTALERLDVTMPMVVRLDGTNDVEGRAILAEAAPPNLHVAETMLGAAEQVVELAGAS